MNLDVLTTDFVILSEGTSIAFPVAKRTAGRIVVIEKELIRRGARGRSSALVRCSRVGEGNRSRPQFEYVENQAKEAA